MATARRQQQGTSRSFWTSNIPPGFNIKVYVDDTDEYVCCAWPGKALNVASWRVFKTTADGSLSFADNSFEFEKLATDLTQVKTYTYLT